MAASIMIVWDGRVVTPQEAEHLVQSLRKQGDTCSDLQQVHQQIADAHGEKKEALWNLAATLEDQIWKARHGETLGAA